MFKMLKKSLVFFKYKNALAKITGRTVSVLNKVVATDARLSQLTIRPSAFKTNVQRFAIKSDASISFNNKTNEWETGELDPERALTEQASITQKLSDIKERIHSLLSEYPIEMGGDTFTLSGCEVLVQQLQYNSKSSDAYHNGKQSGHATLDLRFSTIDSEGFERQETITGLFFLTDKAPRSFNDGLNIKHDGKDFHVVTAFHSNMSMYGRRINTDLLSSVKSCLGVDGGSELTRNLTNEKVHHFIKEDLLDKNLQLAESVFTGENLSCCVLSQPLGDNTSLEVDLSTSMALNTANSPNRMKHSDSGFLGSESGTPLPPTSPFTIPTLINSGGDSEHIYDSAGDNAAGQTSQGGGISGGVKSGDGAEVQTQPTPVVKPHSNIPRPIPIQTSGNDDGDAAALAPKCGVIAGVDNPDGDGEQDGSTPFSNQAAVLGSQVVTHNFSSPSLPASVGMPGDSAAPAPQGGGTRQEGSNSQSKGNTGDNDPTYITVEAANGDGAAAAPAPKGGGARQEGSNSQSKGNDGGDDPTYMTIAAGTTLQSREDGAVINTTYAVFQPNREEGLHKNETYAGHQPVYGTLPPGLGESYPEGLYPTSPGDTGPVSNSKSHYLDVQSKPSSGNSEYFDVSFPNGKPPLDPVTGEHLYAQVDDPGEHLYAELGPGNNYMTVFPASGTNFNEIMHPKGVATLGRSQASIQDVYKADDTIDSLRVALLGLGQRVRLSPFETTKSLKELVKRLDLLYPSIKEPLQTLVQAHERGVSTVRERNQRIKELDSAIQSCPELFSKSILDTMNKWHESEKSSVETYQEHFFDRLKSMIPTLERMPDLTKEHVGIENLEGESLRVTLSSKLIDVIKAKIQTDSQQQSAEWIKEKEVYQREMESLHKQLADHYNKLVQEYNKILKAKEKLTRFLNEYKRNKISHFTLQPEIEFAKSLSDEALSVFLENQISTENINERQFALLGLDPSSADKQGLVGAEVSGEADTSDAEFRAIVNQLIMAADSIVKEKNTVQTKCLTQFQSQYSGLCNLFGKPQESGTLRSKVLSLFKTSRKPNGSSALKQTNT